MSELTLTVIRLGLLALLWIFVFSVVGVLRGDLYGTRSSAAARRRAPAPAPAAARAPPPRRSRRRRPRPSAARRRQARPDLAASPRARWPAPRCRCRPPASCSAATPSARWCWTTTSPPAGTPASTSAPTALVRRGPRLHQRHLPGQRPAHRPVPRRGRRDAADRQDRPRAAEVGQMAIALRYAARSNVGLGAQEPQPGLRLRRAAPARRSPTAWAGTPPATSPARSSWASWSHLDGESHGGDDALQLLASSLHAANPSLREAMEGNAELRRHGHHRRSPCCAPATRWRWPTSATPAATSLRDGTLTQITRDHSYVQSLRRRGPDQRRRRPSTTRSGPWSPASSPATRATSPTCRCARPVPATATSSAPTGCPTSSPATPSRRSSPRALGTAATAERLIEIALRAGTPRQRHRRSSATSSTSGPATPPPPPRRWSAPRPTAARTAPRRRCRPARPRRPRRCPARSPAPTEDDDDEVELAESGPSLDAADAGCAVPA